MMRTLIVKVNCIERRENDPRWVEVVCANEGGEHLSFMSYDDRAPSITATLRIQIEDVHDVGGNGHDE